MLLNKPPKTAWRGVGVQRAAWGCWVAANLASTAGLESLESLESWKAWKPRRLEASHHTTPWLGGDAGLARARTQAWGPHSIGINLRDRVAASQDGKGSSPGPGEQELRIGGRFNDPKPQGSMVILRANPR